VTKRVLVLVEGQTEERFVKDVLSPAFLARGLYLTPTLLVTKRVKDGANFKGGVTSFAKFSSDLQRLLSDKTAFVTTLLDFYGLPADFPGMNSQPLNTAARARVQHVETAIHQYFGCPDNFFPFVTLHEFEAWLFADQHALSAVMGDKSKAPLMADVRAQFATPEDINERPEWAPSKRIRSFFPGYRKTLHGPIAVSRIGLGRIRAECHHFAGWLDWLDACAAA
jgi:hypothetical protein